MCQVILKIIDKHGDVSTAYQCKPKTKPKVWSLTKRLRNDTERVAVYQGNKSYILKGTDTKSNIDHILAGFGVLNVYHFAFVRPIDVMTKTMTARFKSEDTAQSFRMAIESAAEVSLEMLSTSPQCSKPSLHPRNSSMEPEEIEKRLRKVPIPNLCILSYSGNVYTVIHQKGAWDCKLCTCRNEATARRCAACRTPRMHMLQKVVSICDLEDNSSLTSNHSDTLDPSSSSSSALSVFVSLPSPSHSKASNAPNPQKQQNLMIRSMYGDGSMNPNTPRTPKQFGQFDWSSADANTKLHAEPSPEGGDVDTTKKDFVRILTTIESNIPSTKDPLKLYEDLGKVSRRLQVVLKVVEMPLYVESVGAFSWSARRQKVQNTRHQESCGSAEARFVCFA